MVLLYSCITVALHIPATRGEKVDLTFFNLLCSGVCDVPRAVKHVELLNKPIKRYLNDAIDTRIGLELNRLKSKTSAVVFKTIALSKCQLGIIHLFSRYLSNPYFMLNV